MNKLIIYFNVLIVFFAHSAFAGSGSVHSSQSKATLVSEFSSIVPGGKTRVGLLLEHAPGWHSYWQNPGDAGLATELKWTLPEGFSASTIDWPAPTRMKEGDLATYGFSDQLLLPVALTMPLNLEEKNYSIIVKAQWLICKEICIPESAELEINLPVSTETKDSEYKPLFTAHDANKPEPRDIPYSYSIENKQLHFAIPYTDPISTAYFFPREPNVISYSGQQLAIPNSGMLEFFVPLAQEMPQATVSGIVAIEHGGEKKYLDVSLSPIATPPTLLPPSKEEEVSSLFSILLFALIGGLILNLMPCVLPVLSLKALAVVSKAGKSNAHILKHGIAYTLGILISFGVIASCLIALQQAGNAVGWGFQLQSPAFVGFLIYLLFLVGLSLSGFFHLPVLLGNVGNEIASEDSTRGSFTTGILATLVATPCTAPFMASAVGIALTLPAWQSLLIFEMLGLGLALPFLLITIFPACLKFLPKPGAWMDTFKQFLAFPMYAAVIWLLWVLAMQTGPNGMLIALFALLAITITIWMQPLFKRDVNYRITALFFYVAIIFWSLPMLHSMTGNHATAKEHAAFSQASLDALLRDKKPVFVDATAAWCITCQVNKRVIDSPEIMAVFKERNITLMIADWTLRDAEISQWLASFGYQGVPLYVYYPPQGEPVVLPQILTHENVLDALK